MEPEFAASALAKRTVPTRLYRWVRIYKSLREFRARQRGAEMVGGMDLQSVEQLKAPLWRALRLGVAMFLLVASGLLLTSLISASHGKPGAHGIPASSIMVHSPS